MATEAARGPDIVFVLPDQLRRDMCGCYGGTMIPTPGIDRLAREGLVVDNAISPCPVCTPYRGMLMTGRYSTHSGVVNNFVETSPVHNPHTLAVVLGTAGYDTAYIGKWHLAPGEYGRDSEHPSFVPPGPDRLGFEHWEAFNFHMDFNNYWYYRDTPEKVYDQRYETDAVFEQAVDLLRRRTPEDNPLFLVVSPHPPHPPFGVEDAPPGYLESIPDRVAWSDNVPEDPIENPRETEAMRVYLSMVRNLDDNVAMLTDFLDSSQRSSSTLLIFTSDHGEMHGSHGRINKMVPYAEALDVPLIFRQPGTINAGKRTDLLFGPMDYLPTLSAIAGARVPGSADGEDLSDEILSSAQRDVTVRDRELLIMNYSSHWNFFRSDTPETAEDWRCWPEWRGLRSKRYTYAIWLDGHEELYDNQMDPLQLRNCIYDPEYRGILEDHRAGTRRLMEEAHDEFLPGTAYADWFDENRRLVRTALGPAF
ncbi:MAG: sulfatase-like hydrolase/transferase [Alkalispirochaeta sp.]